MKNETTKLLPCPFCGAEILEMESFDGSWKDRVRCPTCKSHGPAHRTKPAAIEAWNARSGQSQIAALRSAVLELILKVRDNPPTVVDNDPLRLAGWTAASTAIIDAILEDNALAATPADHVREAATASQLASTQAALKRLHNAVLRSRWVNDPLGMDAAMTFAGAILWTYVITARQMTILLS